MRLKTLEGYRTALANFTRNFCMFESTHVFCAVPAPLTIVLAFHEHAIFFKYSYFWH
jgi:hypothetical protein